MCLKRSLFTLLLACCPIPLRAEVVRIEIEDRRSFAEGLSFGHVGSYERLKGKLWIEVDPNHPANQRLVDLKLAPTTPQGKVRFWTEFFLLKPADPKRGNHRLLYDVNNRGNKLALAAFNNARSNDPRTPADAGNGFLMRQGYTVLWSGWNGDVEPGEGRMQIELPIARTPDGPITGRIYSEICADNKSLSEPLCWGNTKVYPAADLDNRSATLAMRPRRAAEAVEVPRDRWAFARFEGGKVIPDPTRLYLRDGFRPGWLYDLVYVGKDPRVAGLGTVAVRDAVSFFRFAERDGEGQANPLAGAVERAYAFGISQSARFIHHLIFEDFNGDEAGRTVFDAAFCHVGAAGKAIFNARFAQITRHGSQHEENLYPSDTFPFTTVPQTDPLTGQKGDWLERSRRSGHLPKIFITQTSTEYWNRAGSLLHTDVGGRRDVALDPQVRLYHIAGGHHLFSTPERGICRYQPNTLNYQPLLRALLAALDVWAGSGIEPPASLYPHIADGTLVDVQTCRRSFPRLPGVDLPQSAYDPLRLDLGPRWESEGIADIVPPKIGKPYRTLVPAVDADGNELAGIRLPDIAVPIATYTGWNLRDDTHGAGGMLTRWVGSTFPFQRTPDERKSSGDPRASIGERYPTRQDYLDRIRQAADRLVRERLLLADDVQPLLTRASTQPYWP